METNSRESHEPLLTRSIQQENYNTFTHEEEGGCEASSRRRTASNEDWHEQEVSLGSATEQGIETFRPNERGNSGGNNALQRMTQFFKSNKPLKCTAIGFGLWSELGCWSLVFAIPIAILILPAEFLSGFMWACDFDLGPYEFGNTSMFQGTYSVRVDLDHMAILIVEVPSYLMMIYCIRRLRRQPKALPLPRVFTLATKSKSVNLILLVSITMIVTSMLVRKCFPIPPSGYRYGQTLNFFGGQTHGRFCPPDFIVCQLLNSVVTWQAVVSCLVFGEVMKALATLVDQCYDRMILDTSGNSLNDYIELHQELCCTVETTFSAFKKWFLVNTLGYVVLICWIVIRVFSIFGNFDEVYITLCYKPLDDDDGLLGVILINIYYFLTLLLYAFFVCYYPWHSTASLKNSLNQLVQKLNCKIDWSSEHFLKNRSNLNDFIQYMKNTEYCSLMKFTFREKIPYISISLSVCGLLLTLYARFQQIHDKNHFMKFYWANGMSIRPYNTSIK